jgi:nitrate reductase NapD
MTVTRRGESAVNISGLIVYARPAQCPEALRARLAAIPGVEVHAATADGRLVVTVERPTDGEMTEIFDRIGAVDGVAATALVYHHDEPIDDEPACRQESESCL